MPSNASPSAAKPIKVAATSRTFRKLRTRAPSRRASELAPRTAAMMTLRSLAESTGAGWRVAISFNCKRRGSWLDRWSWTCAWMLGSCPAR